MQGNKQLLVQTMYVWPDMWKHLSDASKKKAKQRWAVEKPKLDNARQLRGIFFIEPNDEEFKLTMKAVRRKFEVPMPAVLLCTISTESNGETHRKIRKRKTKEQQLSAQDPGAFSQPKLQDVTSKESFDKVKIRFSEINKHVSDGTKKGRENQKGRRSLASPKLELVDVMDTFQHAISIVEKETAKNLACLLKEIDTRNPNSIKTALIRRETSRSRAFSEQC